MFNDKWLCKFWESNEIYDEHICFIKDDDGNVCDGTLLFKPDKILSVVSWDGSVVYKEGTDYVKTEHGIKLLNGSSVITIDKSKLYQVLPEGNEGMKWALLKDGIHYVPPFEELYNYEVRVSYTHSDKWNGFLPKDCGNVFKNLHKKLASGKDIKILFYGDSITAGNSASGKDEHVVNCNTLGEMHELNNHAPNMPSWAEMITKSIADKYKIHVEKINRSASCSTSWWGVKNAEQLLSPYSPDVAIIAFGMNNVYLEAAEFKEHIIKIIHTIKSHTPDCEFVIVSPMTANYDMKMFQNDHTIEQEQALFDIANENEGIAVAAVNSLFRSITKIKPYMDLSGNAINHPNDFSVRIYAQTIMKTLGI